MGVHKCIVSAKHLMGNSCSSCYLFINDVTCAKLCTADGSEWRKSIEKTDGAVLVAATAFPWCFHCFSCQIIDLAQKDSWYVILASCITCPVPCIMLPFFRKWTREKYNIKGDFCNDLAQSCLCYPCTLKVITQTLSENQPRLTSNLEVDVPEMINSIRLNLQ